MDIHFDRTIRAKIKALRARAYATELAEGHSGEKASKNADMIIRHHFREQLANAGGHVRKNSLKRILIEEGILT